MSHSLIYSFFPEHLHTSIAYFSLLPLWEQCLLIEIAPLCNSQQLV